MRSSRRDHDDPITKRTAARATRRDLLGLAALGVLAAGTKPARAADGQLIYGLAHLAGADLVRSGGNAGHRHAVHAALRAARRAGEADAGQPGRAVPGGVLDRLRGRAQPQLRAARRRQVPQWRAGDGGGREVLVRALSRQRRALHQGEGGGGRNARSAARHLPPEQAVARFPDLLFERHRRRLDRAEEIRRERRRGRLQEGADRRRTVQVRLVHPGRRAGDGGVRRLLAQDAHREAAGLEGDPRRDDAARGAEARRGRSSPTRSAASSPRSCSARRGSS